MGPHSNQLSYATRILACLKISLCSPVLLWSSFNILPVPSLTWELKRILDTYSLHICVSIMILKKSFWKLWLSKEKKKEKEKKLHSLRLGDLIQPQALRDQGMLIGPKFVSPATASPCLVSTWISHMHVRIRVSYWDLESVLNLLLPDPSLSVATPLTQWLGPKSLSSNRVQSISLFLLHGECFSKMRAVSPPSERIPNPHTSSDLLLGLRPAARFYK